MNKIVPVKLTHTINPGWSWLRVCCFSLIGLCVSWGLRAQVADCSSLLTTRVTSITVCTEKAVDQLQVLTTAITPDEIEFVRFDSLQTNPYKGKGGVSVGHVVPLNGKATLRNVNFPPNWDITDRLYYVYARLKFKSANSTCTPFALIRVFIRANPTASLVVKEATCYNAESQNDGQVSITGFDPTDRYEMAINGTFVEHSNPIPTNGVLVGTGSRTGRPTVYTVRVTNSLGCTTDRYITMINARCDCLPMRCVPIVISKTRRGR
ncbi:hypothetical protein [Spirosoma pollinicola]|uniref:Gliding motility-associated C-terminal domain-containing protein n=1 Tax=Spirosoma pollinicola TaxID=2057025 RepID=A0A2K8YUT1_9BACT|nr:hypothetical protein [Spirosoma pollinicola]AUD01376.1 hypothetical protein CWM47_05855 [Spirosoma pollinicola]